MDEPSIAIRQPLKSQAEEGLANDPPRSTYKGRTKYDNVRSVEYQKQDARKNQAEMKLIERAFTHVPKNCRVLDLPCGGGRAAIRLASVGYDVMAGDLSSSMLEIAAKNFSDAGVPCPIQELDVEDLQLPDRSVDAILCFRLFHHFPHVSIRQNAVGELCRVTRQYVVLSYLDYWSYTAIWRRLRQGLTGKRCAKYANTRNEVCRYFRDNGFELVKDYARMPFFHTLHLAVFKRHQPANDR